MRNVVGGGDVYKLKEGKRQRQRGHSVRACEGEKREERLTENSLCMDAYLHVINTTK